VGQDRQRSPNLLLLWNRRLELQRIARREKGVSVSVKNECGVQEGRTQYTGREDVPAEPWRRHKARDSTSITKTRLSPTGLHRWTGEHRGKKNLDVLTDAPPGDLRRE